MRTLLILILALPLLAQETLDQILEKIPQQSRYEEPQRDDAHKLWDAIWAGQPTTIKGLVDRLDAAGPGADFRPLYALHGLVIYLQGDERSKLVDALAPTLDGDYQATTKALVLRELWIARGRSAIPETGKHLLNPELCEYASQALFSFGGEDAARELRNAAAKAEGKVRVTILRGLGELRDSESVPILIEALKSDNRELRIVAADALAEIGAPAAITPLTSTLDIQSPYERGLIEGACIRLAQRLPKAEGEKLLHQLWERGSIHLQCAVITELAALATDDAIRRVGEACRSEDERMRRTAARAAARMPGREATWFASLADAESARVVFVSEVAFVRSPATALILTAALADSAKPVREAALKAVAHANSPQLTKALIALVIGGDRNAATALRRLQPAPEVDSALAAALPAADSDAKKRLLGLLADRVAYSQREAVRSETKGEAKSDAIKALGVLGNDSDAKLLISAIIEDESVRNRAADALALLVRRSNDQDALLTQLVDAVEGATGPAKAALIRAIGRAANPASLELITNSLKSSDKDVVDAAARALADWPGDEVLDTLMSLAKDSESTTHHVLAIRGIVRLVGDNLKARGEDDSLLVYKQVYEVARRPDERKSVLGAIKRVHHPEALAIAQAALAEDALRRDAESTCLDLADHLIRRDQHRDACTALLEQIAESSQQDNHKQRANDILAKYAKQ
jgi:HEAT repeat protein